ncbi:MAG: sodium/solute symporter [Sedimentisphaerales bacterium]|nr:sodium/solute symporter [Sedimentisphaerales bacterium]
MSHFSSCCSHFILAEARGLQDWDYIVILLYMIGVVSVGVFLSKRQRDSEDYFLGGRKIPWFAAGLSLVASVISTVSYLGVPGETIRHGLANAASNWVIPLAFVVVIFAWLPFFMRLRLTSVYEYLEKRFGLAARLVGVSLFVLILRLGWMALIVLTLSGAVGQITYPSASNLLSSTFGWQVSLQGWLLLVMVAAGLLATLYTMLGGIKAVIWTDVAQYFILMAGGILTIVIIARDTGTGPSQWWHMLSSVKHTPVVVASWDLSERTTLLWVTLYTFFWYVCSYAGDQVAMQRYFSTPSVRSAVWASITNCIGSLLLAAVLAFCGMALLTYYTNFPQEIVNGITNPQDPAAADNVFPHFIGHGLPVGVSGLVVAALFAVAMSSFDSGINSVSTVVTVDVFRRLKPGRSGRDELVLARILTVIIGAGVTGLAVAMMYLPKDWNIIDISLRVVDTALGPLGAMFIVGILLPHVGQCAIVIAALCGFGVALVMAWWVELGWFLGFIEGQTLDVAIQTASRPSSFLVLPFSLLFTFLLAAILGAFMLSPEPEKIKALTWRAVVFGNSR